MKKFPFVLLTIITIPFLAGCNTEQKPSDEGKKYLNQRWYAIGYGSFIDGGNWQVKSGLEFNRIVINGNETHELENVSFKVGDTFRITNADKSIYLEDHYLTSEGSFKSNNVTLYKNNGYNEINVLKSGKYNLKFTISESSYTFSITNGINTTDNLNREKPQGKTYIDVFSHGDQHGVTENTQFYDHMLPSIPQFVTYVKNKMADTSYSDILLSQGDLWQGTYASNFNYGEMLNEVMSYAGYDSFSLGNHEFDWGEKVIASNQATSKVPYVNCNIKELEGVNLAEYVQPYTIIERDGLYIGVIGSIGSTQISAINSNNVAGVRFDDHYECTKAVSDRLRTEFDCDIVIGCFHEGTSTMTSYINKLGDISSVSGKRYIDAAFTSHDHAYTVGEVNGVPYLNSGNNNRALSHLRMYYDSGVVGYATKENTWSTDLNVAEDIGAREIVDKYCTEEIKNKGEEIQGEVDSDFSKTREAPRLMAKAMYEYAQDEGYDVAVAIVNYGRANIYEGSVTYAQLLDTFPFFNLTVIMDAKGSDLKSNAKSNFYYSSNTTQKFDNDKTYKIAVYDYLAYHQSNLRKYDKFSRSYPFNIYAELDKFPCDIAGDYMKKQEGTIKIADYNTINFSFID